MLLDTVPFPAVDESETQAPLITVRPIGREGFDWPPAPPGSIMPPVKITEKTRRSRRTELIDSIETTLLGRTALSFARQTKREDWHPDADETYCWRCAGSVGMHETDGEGCAACRNTKLHWDQGIRVSEYTGPVRDALLDLKFHRWRTTGRELGSALGSCILERMKRAQVDPGETILVPIPTSNRRRIRRGVDHTRVLCEGAARAIGCPSIRILAANHRPEQIGLSMSARGRNMKGAFRVRERGIGRIDDGCRVIILVDDVRTTGATMTAGCKGVRGALKNIKRGSETEIWVATAGVAAGKARDRQILKN
ncbi:MAG: ComF family protein [Phycisphaerales bacterium]|nr:ComF family protein [Phycisphaerales bacterium]